MFNHHLIKRSVAAAAVIGAATFPSGAQAMRIGEGGRSPGPSTSTPFAPQAVAVPHSSFQWGDAGIGAAGAVVLLGTGAVGAIVTRRRGRAVVG
jgi:hypothetical protein